MQTLSLRKTYKKYPEYKDSEVDWLDKIPNNWELASMRKLFSTNKIHLKDTADQYKILSLTLQGVIPRVMDGSGKNPADYSTYQGFKKNDLVFCQFDYDVTPRTIGYVNEDGMMTGAYTRLDPQQETYSKYYYYYFLSLDYTKELLHLCTGLRNSLSKPLFWSLKNPLPNFNEQVKIAKYLDEKTIFIDQIIEKKKKLIELLKEKRTAIINQTVTKGREQRVELVDSEVVWLGKIPANWRIDKLLHNLTGNDGGVWGQDDLSGNGNFVFRSTEISQNGSWNLEQAITRKLTPNEFSKGKLLEGDLLITKSSGSSEHLGKTAIVTKEIELKESAYSNFMQRLRPNSNYLPKYLFYLLNNRIGREQINYWGSTTTGLVNLNGSIIGKFIFPIPPIAEQEKIIKYLDVIVVFVDQIIERVNKSILNLQEFKSSLISNVVTGKVKI